MTLNIVIIYFYGYKCANKHTQANEHGAEKLSPCITLTLSQCQKNSNTTIENSSKCEKGQKSYMQEDQQHQLMSGPLIFPDATYSINFREGAAGNLGRHTPKKMWEHTLLPYFFAWVDFSSTLYLFTYKKSLMLWKEIQMCYIRLLNDHFLAPIMWL